MKFSVVSYHLPHPDGTATGRHVFAVWDEVRRQGHEVQAWCWGDVPDRLEPPAWVRCAHFHDPGGWRALPRTIRRPRGGLAQVGWEPPPDAIAWAEEPESYAAIEAAARRAVTVYHSSVLDAVALRQPRAAIVQSARAERRAVRSAGTAIAFSPRVARAIGIDNLLPVTLPIPATPVSLVEEPVVLMLANWAWPPNRVALDRLIRSWPQVSEQVPGARLLLAGRGMRSAPEVPGVEVLGEVAQARDALAQASVFAFPCPPTSGPKMKVLDALANGVPVVTTTAGIEGLIDV
ncbi:MAG: glycosyltransferase family 4 protein, partial [Frankiaceae bacterium]|nr:glycosyltransferase family 4 protein [Frankiaceae bacterium]